MISKEFLRVAGAMLGRFGDFRNFDVFWPQNETYPSSHLSIQRSHGLLRWYEYIEVPSRLFVKSKWSMRLHTFREINKNVTEIYQNVLKFEIAISPRSGITLRAWLSSSLNLLYESLGGRKITPTGPRERKSSGSGNVNKSCFPTTVR